MIEAILPSEVSEEMRHERMLEMWIREILALMRKPDRDEVVIHERQLAEAVPLLTHLYALASVDGPSMMTDGDRWTDLDKTMQGLREAGFGYHKSPSFSSDDATHFYSSAVEHLDDTFKKYPYLDGRSRILAEYISKVAARAFVRGITRNGNNRFSIMI